MAFFTNEDKELIEPFIDDIVSRAVSLMAWREVDEVLPYYCEGLIHLELLYNCGLIKIEDSIVKIDYNRYPQFKEIYTQAYKELARAYINKEDASSYLNLFVRKNGKVYLPRTTKLLEFVEYYYSEYKSIGNQVAKEFL